MSYSIITPWEEMEYPNNVGVIFTDSNFMINLGKEFFAKPGLQNRNKSRDDLLDLFKRIREYNIPHCRSPKVAFLVLENLI